MNELILRELLDRAAGEEPPAGLLAQNALRLGVRLRRRRQLRAAVSSAAAIAVTGVSVPAVLGATGSPSPSPAASPGRHIAYVVTGKDCATTDRPAADARCRRETPDGAVMVLDTTTGKILRTIKIPPGPLEAALTPDGETLYVATDSGIVPVDLAAGRAGRTISVGEDTAEAVHIVMTPDGKTLYVSSYLADKVIPIDTATNTAGVPIRVDPRPGNMAITPDGKTVYVSDELANTVTPVDTATNTAGKPILIADPKVYGDHVFPGPIAITPDGKTAYVASWIHVTPISTATNTAGTPIKVGFNSSWLTVSPDGSTVYALDGGYPCHLLPISTATNTPGTPILDPEQSCAGLAGLAVGGPPNSIAFAPRGSTAYVADYGTRQVLPFSTASGHAAAPIRLRVEVGSMVITPNGKTLFVTSVDGDTITPINTRTKTARKPIDLGVRADVILMAR
jgi:YVTN family beta-propeller protein